MNNFKSNYNGVRGIITGAISAICFFVSRTFFNSSIDMAHKLAGIGLFPSLWILNILSFLFFFLIGYSAGVVMDASFHKLNLGEREKLAYCGGLYLISAFFLALIWHPVLFSAEKIFLALLIAVLCLACSLICAFKWSQVVPTKASVIMVVCAIFVFYLVVITSSAFFCI